jgi:PAB-dependent poly(A)-specific ribonuclease subunit 3
MKSRKTWACFDFSKGERSESRLTREDSTPARRSSNPPYSSQRSLPRRSGSFSESSKHSPFLDTGSQADAFQVPYENPYRPFLKWDASQSPETAYAIQPSLKDLPSVLDDSLPISHCHHITTKRATPDTTTVDLICKSVPGKDHRADRFLEHSSTPADHPLPLIITCLDSSPDSCEERFPVSFLFSRSDMASAPFRVPAGDARRPNRIENRPPTGTVLCRNGPQCRKFQEGELRTLS